MYYITRLCDSVIWLKNGGITMEGSAHEVTQAYETYQLKKEVTGQNGEIAGKSKINEVSSVFIKGIILTPFPTVRSRADLNIEIEVNTRNNSIPYRVAAVLKRIDELAIVGIGTKDQEPLTGDRKVNLCFPSIQLKQGTFFIAVHIMDENFIHIYDSKASSPFNVPKETMETGFLDLPYRWTI